MLFQEIPGQEKIKAKLIQTVLDQRVSHAQLFYGPEGSGKLALAIAYAQFINCTGKVLPPFPGEGRGGVVADLRDEGRGGAIDSCGVCPSCVKYQKLIHPDLHFMYPVATTKKVSKHPISKKFLEDWRPFLIGNNYKVTLQGWYEAIDIENKQGIINAEDCNDLITTLSYKSYESEYKVMIIWMVERLFHSAAPKILKILEEPPDKTLFILVAEEPGQIISTILSRTLMVRIPATDAQSPVTPEEDLQFFDTFRHWMRQCYSANVPELIAFAGETGKSGRERQKSFLLYSLGMIGACSDFNHRGIARNGVSREEIEFLQKFSPFIRAAALPEFNELFNSAIFHVERNAHGPTLFLDLSLKIVRIFKPNFVPLS
jgi:DNA polymerase-3 subunit delta'